MRFSIPTNDEFCNSLKNKYPTFSSVSFVCSSEIKTTNDDETGLSRQPQGVTFRDSLGTIPDATIIYNPLYL
jgi:hypothetical protein